MNYRPAIRFARLILLGVALCCGYAAAGAPDGAPPTTPTQLFDSINAALRRGDSDAAIAVATQGLADVTLSERESASVHHLRGLAFFSKEQKDKAIADFSAAIELRPYYLDAIKHRGLAYLASNQYDLAIDDFTEALSMEKKDIPVLIDRSSAYAAQGHLDKALADSDKAVQLVPEDDNAARSNPVFAQTYSHRANIYLHADKYDQALIDLNKALQIDTDRSHILITRGFVYFAKRQYDLAIADFDDVLRGNPQSTSKENAYLYRGDAHDGRGEYDLAVADFNEVLSLHPDDIYAMLGLGRSQQHSEDFDHADKTVDHMMQVKPDDVQALEFAGCYHFSRHDFQRADDDFSRALTVKPSDVHAMIWRDLSLARIGVDGRTELADRSSGLKNHGWPYPAIGYLMGTTDRQGLLEAAKSDNATSENFHLCQASSYIGEMELVRGDKESALASFRDAESRCPPLFNEFGLAQAEIKRQTAGK